MKTILHVIDTTGPGGAETVFIQLADRLREHGYRPVVVIHGSGWVQDELQRRGLNPLIVNTKGAFNWRFLCTLLSVIRRERIDLIQSHLLGSNVYCGLAGLLTGRPVIATFHGIVDINPNERLRWLKFKLMNWGVNRFVTVSCSLRDAIRDQGLLNPARTEVIYNGIDLTRYGKSTRRELRDRLGLTNNAILVGSLGNLRLAKAYDILIKAVRAVIEHYPEVHFVIAGDIKQSLMSELDRLMAEQDVSKHVHFLGYLNNSAEFLSQVDLFLLSSTSEGFSISTIEAMATGLPVLVTRCGGPEEIVRPDVDGLMVAPGNPEVITEGLLLMLSNRQLAQRLAVTGQTRARMCFGVDKMLECYISLYESLT